MTVRRGIWTLACLGAIIALCTTFFYNAGWILDYTQAPRRSDVIIVLGGGPPQRVQRAVQLFREGFAPLILASGGAIYNPWSDQAQEMAKQAEAMGVPARDVILENHSQSTYQNATYTLEVMKAHHFRSAIVVSSDYHMLRAAFDFTRVYLGSGIRLTYCAAPDSVFHPGHWWTSHASVQTTISEYEDLAASIIFYLL